MTADIGLSAAMKKWNDFVSSRPPVEDVFDVLLATPDPEVCEAAWNQLVVLKGDTFDRLRQLVRKGVELQSRAVIPVALMKSNDNEDLVAIIVHWPELRYPALDRLLRNRPSLDHLRIAFAHCSDQYRADVASYIIVHDGVTAEDLAKIGEEFSFFRVVCILRTEQLSERARTKDFLLQS